MNGLLEEVDEDKENKEPGDIGLEVNKKYTVYKER